MKNKSVFWLFLLGLLIMVPVIAACSSYVSPPGPIIPMPHDVNLGFSNCLVCHTGGQYPIPIDAFHNNGNIGNDTCTSPACHPLQAITTPPPTTTTTTPTTTPPTTTPPTTTPPTTTPPTTTPTTTTPTESPGPLSYEYHFLYTDVSTCVLCHVGPGAVLANPEDHADYANDSCFDAGCHEPPVQE